LDDDWFRDNDRGDRRPTTRARHLRQNRTEAERKLWTCINARKLAGVRFNQQFPIGGFICDFVSRERRLVIELDGGQHAFAHEYDTRRTRFLESRGYKVIRFWNGEVLGNIEGVLKVIRDTLRNMPSPGPSRRREGSLRCPPPSGGRTR
jgi:very-short-patch-repair endonuclease